MSTEENMAYMNRDERGSANKLWLLVEYRTFVGKISHKNYEVVEAKDVCGAGGPDHSNVESMHTGNIVYIRGDKGLVQATIVTISDDKFFLDTELKELRQLQLQDTMAMKKRKREPSSRNDATHYNQYHQSWNGKLAEQNTQQTIVVSSSRSSTSSTSHTPVARAASPPMTFCQQTQTDFKGSYDGLNGGNNNHNNEAKLTKVIQTQTNMNLDIQQIKQQVTDLGKQLVDVKLLLNEILSKCNRPESRNSGSVTEHKIIVAASGEPYTPTSNRSQFNVPKILNLSHSSNVSHTSQTTFSNAIIEPVEASNDSTYSFSNNSRMSLNASNQSIYQNDSPNGDQVESKVIVQSMRIERLNGSHSNIQEAFAEEDGNPEDEISIGNNNTTIPRHVLSNINWNSHTAATRRLLRTKFSREVLATHSLTGKPSPGESSFYLILIRIQSVVVFFS